MPKKVEGGSAATGLLHNGQPGKESGGLRQWDRGKLTVLAWRVTSSSLALKGAVMSTDLLKQEVGLSPSKLASVNWVCS